MDQILQLVGAVMILVAFVAAQRGAWSPHSIVYLVLNLVGSVVLFVVAYIGSDWGFLLLEVVWAIVSAHSLVAVLRGRTPTAAH
ncbi:MAG: hypothetical protein H0V85_01175 [Thermoleophilaceae bacterium]|jgi:hypothetical protein|nr:hypothetical protein [Thermoleophilaceae bacterium]